MAELRMERIMRLLRVISIVLVLVVFSAVGAFATSGHFITGGNKAPSCTDTGLTVECTGKVAGLGGTTFEITVEATGIATVECTNPGGNVAPGQTFTFDAVGTSGPLPTPRNGQYTFTISTDAPPAPAGSCPNPQWSAAVVDVEFSGMATLSLFEDGTLSDQVSVSIG